MKLNRHRDMPRPRPRPRDPLAALTLVFQLMDTYEWDGDLFAEVANVFEQLGWTFRR